jgi:hypothetical protein
MRESEDFEKIGRTTKDEWEKCGGEKIGDKRHGAEVVRGTRGSSRGFGKSSSQMNCVQFGSFLDDVRKQSLMTP